MSTTNHSPGPWHVGANGTIIYDADGMPVASASVYHGRTQPRTAQFNAVLLAAAPHLRKALQWAIGMAEEAILAREEGDDPQDTPDVITMHREALRDAMAALRSAKELRS